MSDDYISLTSSTNTNNKDKNEFVKKWSPKTKTATARDMQFHSSNQDLYDDSDSDHNHDYDDDDDNVDSSDNDNNNERRIHRMLQQEKATYGSFLDDSDNDDEIQRQRRRKQKTNKQSNHKMNSLFTPPLFVKGEVETNSHIRSGYNNNNNDNNKQQDDTISIKKEEEEQNEKTNNEKEEPEQQQQQEEEELTTEEMEFQKKQQQADDYFRSLLEQGRKRKRSTMINKTKNNDNIHYHQQQDNNETQTNVQSVSTSLSSPVVQRRPSSSTSTFATKVGTWEKHTKGIGMKLLTKMGYQGVGGLGSKKRIHEQEETTTTTTTAVTRSTGISKPIEVKVRPTYLGLGFGNFQEATQLKTNRQIEAEVRGIPLETKDQHNHDDSHNIDNTEAIMSIFKSILPQTQDLMKDQSWKRGAKEIKSKINQRSKATRVIPYTEIVEQQQQQQVSSEMKIIDLRGSILPTTENIQQQQQQQDIPLAEELLHNVSLVLGTLENNMYSVSSFVRSTERKLETTIMEVNEMDQKNQNWDNRLQKLIQLQTILDSMEQLCSTCKENNRGDDYDDNNNDDENLHLRKLRDHIESIRNLFSPQERKELQFMDVIIPSILGVFIKERMKTWKPLKDTIIMSKKRIQSILQMASIVDDETTSSTTPSLVETLLLQYIVPTIKKALESSKWDPVQSSIEGANLLELLERIVRPIDALKTIKKNRSQSTHDDETDTNVLPDQFMEENDTSNSLWQRIRENIVFQTVHDRLVRSLAQWKPHWDGTDIQDRIDLWILPWMPYLEGSALLPSFLADCKRKLRHVLNYLEQKRWTKNDVDNNYEEFWKAMIRCVVPWRSLLSVGTIQKMLSVSVVPRLARALSQSVMESSSQDKSTSLKQKFILNIMFEMHQLDLLSNVTMLSLLEGEVFSTWVVLQHENIVQGQLKDVAQAYVTLKKELMFLTAHSNTRTQQLIWEDEMICRYLNSILQMLRCSGTTSILSNDDDDDVLYPPDPVSFSVVLTRRISEDNQRMTEEYWRMEGQQQHDSEHLCNNTKQFVEAQIRLRKQRIGGGLPTFREVVEEMAHEHDIVFQPKTIRSDDGKQIFLFGKTPIYMESNVIYACDGNPSLPWKPMSIDALLEQEKHSSTSS